MQNMKIGAGQTERGDTDWKQYSLDGLYVDVATGAGEFTGMPLYLASVSCWASPPDLVLVGSGSVHHPTPAGFRMYVKSADHRPLSPEMANGYGWSVNWVGIQLFPDENVG